MDILCALLQVYFIVLIARIILSWFPVQPGTTIVWTNHDEAPHTVVSDDKSFISKGLDPDDRFEHTFEREGDFAYICSVHPFMTGVVHVHR